MAKILVVDDEPEVRDFLKDALRLGGHALEAASNGTSALEMLKGQRFDIVILDRNMPGMSGLEFLRRLRSAGNDIPLVLLADESDVPTAVAAMREGATDFIEKPYVSVAILKQVQKLLRGKNAPSRA